MITIYKERIKEIIDNYKDKTIAVIGDVMLDRYFWGTVSRVSPEAPVPVVDVERELYHMGGAANVAANLNSLGIKSILCGITGNDEYGRIFKDLANENNIDPKGLFIDNNRPTTVKTRIFGNNQQIVRLDIEKTSEIPDEGEKYILRTIQETKEISAIIFCDYNKGALSDILIREVINYSKNNKIPVFVDPKFENFFTYQNVTMLKPNKKEVEGALNRTLRTENDIIDAGKELLEKLHCKNLLLTLGANGMKLFESNGEISSIQTKARHVSDVSGAGDTAIATYATSIIGGADVKEATTIANAASGIVCERPGIVSITKQDILGSF